MKKIASLWILLGLLNAQAAIAQWLPGVPAVALAVDDTIEALKRPHILPTLTAAVPQWPVPAALPTPVISLPIAPALPFQPLLPAVVPGVPITLPMPVVPLLPTVVGTVAGLVPANLPLPPLPINPGALLPAALQELLQGMSDPSGLVAGAVPCEAAALCQVELSLSGSNLPGQARLTPACEFIGAPELRFDFGALAPGQASAEKAARVAVTVRCAAGLRYRLRVTQGVSSPAAARLAAHVGQAPAWVQLIGDNQPLGERQFIASGEAETHEIEAWLIDDQRAGRTPFESGTVELPPDVALRLEW